MKFKHLSLVSILIIAFVITAGCAGKNNGDSSPVSNNSSNGATVQETTITNISQSNTTSGEAESITVSDLIDFPLIQAESEAFMNENPGKTINVHGSIPDFIDGNGDIVTSARDMTDTEIKIAQKRGITPVKTIIGYDAIAVIVNSINPVSNLTLDQLHDIYDGPIINWKSVDGNDFNIIPISAEGGSDLLPDFQKEVLHGSLNTTPLVQTNAVEEVSQNPDTIGYIYLKEHDNTTKALSIDNGNGSIYPTPDSVLSGKYPLPITLSFYTNGEPTGLKKQFIDFVLSDEGQNIVKKVGCIPLKK